MSIKKVTLIILLVLFSFFSSFKNIKAEILFFDDFNDGDANDWIVPRNSCNSMWKVQNNKYGRNFTHERRLET